MQFPQREKVVKSLVTSSRANWIVVSATGFAVGLGAAIVLGEPIEQLLPRALTVTVAGMMALTVGLTCAGGGILGTAQWFSQRGRALPILWIPLTAVGLGLGVSVGTAIVEHVGELATGQTLRFVRLPVSWQVLALAAVGASIGVFLGTAQALLLGARAGVTNWLRRALFAPVLALPASLLVVRVGFGALNTLPAFGAFLLLAGALIAAITGAPPARASARAPH